MTDQKKVGAIKKSINVPISNLPDELPSEAEMFGQIMVTADAWQNRLSRSQIEQWLSNFKGKVFDVEYERQLALWLLCNFVYYNQNEVRHLCQTAFREFLHYMLGSLPIQESRDLAEAANGILENTRFYHSGRPGESGAFILYFFRQENNLGVSNFLTQPDSLPTHVKTIVFVDDVVLTGDQAEPYLKKVTKIYGSKRKKILLTFFSTEDAENLLRKNDITVISCIKLDQRSKCFSPDSDVFANHPTHREKCERMASEYGAKLKPDRPLGYGNGQYAFAFYYNTPDNTLPLFWAERNGWIPIMKRYNKIYGKGGSYELGRFI